MRGELRLRRVYSIQAIKDIPPKDAPDFELILWPSRSRWLWDPGSVLIANDTTIVRPAWATTVGRWLKLATPTSTGGSSFTSPLSFKGDLFTFDTADARLPVGANGYVLKADSGEPTGLKWDPLTGSYSPPIPESDVSGLVSDLSTLSAAISTESGTRSSADSAEAAARSSADAAEASARASADALLVPKSRVLTTTAPLKIAAGASADLSVDRTLSVDDATGSTVGVVKLANDLGGTAALPKVVAITETSGPTQLVVGSIPDGYVAKRVSGTFVGVDPSTFGSGIVDTDQNILANQVFGG